MSRYFDKWNVLLRQGAEGARGRGGQGKQVNVRVLRGFPGYAVFQNHPQRLEKYACIPTDGDQTRDIKFQGLSYTDVN